MALVSIVWIVASRCSCWARQKTIEYIELDNLDGLGKDEEDELRNSKRHWRCDIKGIVRDCVYTFILVAICIMLQIIGVY